jgi:hypothetical protein
VETDRVTKLLLAAIAAGVWALVLLNGVTTSRLAELNAEVKAIGLDTEQIHEDLDPGGDDEASSGKTLQRGHDNAVMPNAANAENAKPRANGRQRAVTASTTH